MSRTQIKYLVIIAMLIDHIAWCFIPTASALGQIMHFIGRLTAPTMAYFIAEGYCHTRNVKKYALRLGIFAILSWIPYIYLEFGRLPIYFTDGHIAFDPTTSVIYTLFLGLLAIWLWDKGACPRWCKVLGVIGLCAVSLIGDWACFNVLWCLFFFLFRQRPKQMWIAFSIVGAICCVPILYSKPWWRYLFMFGIFMVPFLLRFCYNGQPGKKSAVSKWFFYVFYPAHMLILGILRWVILR